jgi:hypothetical protein
VVLVALLYEESDTAFLARDDADGLFPLSVPISVSSSSGCAKVFVENFGNSWEFVLSYLVGDLALILQQVSPMHSNFAQTTTYLAAVQVPQVEGVARELHAVRPLDKGCAVSLCPQISSKSQIRSLFNSNHSLVISHARSPGIVAAILKLL